MGVFYCSKGQMDGAIEDAADANEQGKLCQLPFSRVKKIMKADKDVGQCGQEAIFIATCATV